MDYQELLNQIAQMLEQSEARTVQRMQDLETRLSLKMENEIVRRIDSLFDGYKLTHEKQWELEHRTEQLQNQVNDLQARLAALENKIA